MAARTTQTPLRVLHLEDSADDAALVEMTLRHDGLNAKVTRVDTRDAFESELRRGVHDLVLADYNLPSFDGATAQQLAAECCPHVPFIFVSGSIGEEQAIDRVKAGATDYVLKDRLNRLLPAVRRAMSEAAERAERRRSDEEVRRLNAELEQRVIDRTQALAAANEALQKARHEAERANLAKSEFLSRMSHDLRTPLNAILGFAQLLIGEENEVDRAEYARQILSGGRHLLELINEVLDIARIESGQLSLSPEPVYVTEVARQVLDLVAPLAAAQNIRLVLEPDPCNDLPVIADRQRFAQILVNLVSNAVKYNRPAGSVTLKCAHEADKRLRISVTDTGAGIPPEKLKLLFQPFERLGADSTSIEGTGLGLALSRGLAAAMRGTMGVESEVDRGTTFWLELPVSEAAPSAAPELADAPRADVRRDVSGTILYIEDNQSNVRLMERILRRRPSVKLLHAASGSTGITMARQHRPTAIFLDLHLPDVPGEEVLRRLWEDHTLRPIPVAVLSADAMAGQMRRLKAGGAAAYLVKPLDIGEVLSLVDKMLGQPSEMT
jgi:signal transduction histidine kinase/ActR/RegA family two-component response regulator